MEFLNPKLFKKFFDFGIVKADKDETVLKPYLLKKYQEKVPVTIIKTLNSFSTRSFV